MVNRGRPSYSGGSFVLDEAAADGTLKDAHTFTTPSSAKLPSFEETTLTWLGAGPTEEAEITRGPGLFPNRLSFIVDSNLAHGDNKPTEGMRFAAFRAQGGWDDVFSSYSVISA